MLELSSTISPDSTPASTMAPTLRSSESAAVARPMLTTRKTDRERYNALRDIDAAHDRAERTKRGCWTCRIRRKKCDENQIEERCATCRRLGLECMGWGVKRPEWMKDKKAVDNKRAEIKVQLQSQNMIRGQAKNVSIPQRPTTNATAAPAPTHSRSSLSSFLTVPDPRSRPRSNSNDTHSRHTSSSPSTARPQRAAKLQANRNLNLYNQRSPSPSLSVSGTSQPPSPSPDALDDDPDASGEDDYSTSPFLSPNDDDSDMSPLAPQEGLPIAIPIMQLQQPAHVDLSSEASLADLLLSGLGAYSEDHAANYLLQHGMSDDLTAGNLGIESTSLSGSSGFDTISSSYADAFDLGLPMNGHGGHMMSGELDPYNFKSATLAIGSMLSTTTTAEEIASLPGVSFGSGGGNGIRPSVRVPALDMDMDISPSDVSSMGPITSPVASIGGGARVTVTSPTGITSPVDDTFQMGRQEQMNAATSYFTTPTLADQRKMAATVPTQQPGPSTSSGFAVSTPVALGGMNGVVQQQSVAVGPQQHSRGHFPQPTQSQRQVAASVTTGYAQQPAQQHAVVPYSPRLRSPLADPTRSLSTFQETLIFYYFNRGVRRMQYLLADDSTTGVTDVMYDLVIRDPLGPVTSAICSLASLHDTRLRIAHGLIHPEDPSAHDNAQKLYSETVMQLADKAGAFTDVEAIASLHLLSFWLFCGGGGDWGSALGLAGDWLARTELVRDETRDPMDILADWKPAMRFAAQTTLWFDILSGCSLKQAPRFLKLYRRLKQANALARESATPVNALFNGSSNSTYNRQGKAQRKPGAPPSLMDSVMGCDDEIMFALAEISALAEWKEKQIARRRLSFIELVARAKAIELELAATRTVSSPSTAQANRRSASPSSSSVVSQMSPLNTFGPGGSSSVPGVWDSYNASTMISAMPPAAPPPDAVDPSWGNMGLHHRSVSLTSPPPQRASSSRGSSPAAQAAGALTVATPAQPITLRQLCSNVFREAAFLYLCSVVSGCEPAVREIHDGVGNLIAAICAIPSTDLDRSLAFPITLGGCLTDRPEQREFFSERLAAQGSAVGNGSQAKLLMETVWKRRDTGDRGICWRDTMKDLGFDLLLV